MAIKVCSGGVWGFRQSDGGGSRGGAVGGWLGLVLVAAIFGLGWVPVASAGERNFTYVYETTTLPKGAAEYEQWVTWKTHKDDDPDFDRFEFRHEFEFGLTDRLQLAVYLADWRYQDGASVADNEADYRGTAVEVIYNLTNPVTDAIGSALYGEVKLGDELFEIEGKILLQKNIGPWIIAYNVILESEWEGEDYEEDKGEFGQAFGVSYQVNPSLTVGAELIHELEFDDWHDTGEDVVYVGPNVSYRAKGWWVTLTQLFQVSDVGGEADFQTRMLFAIDF